VLAAGSSGILLHEAIGHGMEADFNRKNVSIYSDKIGKPVAKPFVNIVDEATQEHARGAINVDGRYAQVSSSDLRREALERFIGDSVTMTRVLAEDPYRSLPDPSLYQGRAGVDLQLEDPAYAGVTPERRREAAKQMEEAARAAEGAEAILSVSLVFEGPCSSRGCRADAVPSGGAVVAAAGAAQIRRDRTSSGTRLRRAG
jgi:predicted Zn-dependent protease